MGEKSGIAPSGDIAIHGAELFLKHFAEPYLALDQELTVIEANVLALDFLHLDKSHLAGSNIRDLFKLSEGELGKLNFEKNAWIQIPLKTSEPCRALWTPLPNSEQNAPAGLLIFSGRLGMAKKAEEELEQLRKSQDDFIYSISHDLRAPLRAIQGFSNLLIQELGESSSALALTYLQRMIAASNRMEAYMGDLLVLSRIARADILLRPIHLDSIIEAAQRELAPLIQQQNAVVEIAGPLHAVAGTSALCQYALCQILHNALTYVAPGVSPRIRISAQQNETVRIEVADNGLGISPEHHQKIFKPFERLHSGDTYPGTGLGLTIVERAMHKLGGTVEVNSELGKGSKFALNFQKPPTL